MNILLFVCVIIVLIILLITSNETIRYNLLATTGVVLSLLVIKSLPDNEAIDDFER
jgi:hypothetical protein